MSSFIILLLVCDGVTVMVVGTCFFQRASLQTEGKKGESWLCCSMHFVGMLALTRDVHKASSQLSSRSKGKTEHKM